MIWNGRTAEQRTIDYRRGVYVYAWLPTQMVDGRWVWFQRHWTALHGAPNGRNYWVNAIDRADCVQRAPTTPKPPKK